MLPTLCLEAQFAQDGEKLSYCGRYKPGSREKPLISEKPHSLLPCAFALANPPLEMFSAPRALFSCSFSRIHATTYVTWPSLPPCQSLQPHECTLAMSEFSVLTVQAGRGVPGCVASVFFTRCPMILAHQPSRLVPRWAPCGHSLGRWGPSPRSQSDGSSVQLVSRYY
jgi:hypothetical protein